MRRCAVPLFAVLLAAIAPQTLAAQPYPAEDQLNAQQKLGRDLFVQHCMVCHEHTQITAAGHFGPDISGRSLDGKDNALFAQISDGSPNMPGFKYNYTPAQIDAVVSYLKTLEPPAAEPAKTKPAGAKAPGSAADAD